MKFLARRHFKSPLHETAFNAPPPPLGKRSVNACTLDHEQTTPRKECAAFSDARGSNLTKNASEAAVFCGSEALALKHSS